jgi:hypothetical protein
LKYLVLAIGPALDRLLPEKLKALGDQFLGLVSFDDIALGIFNNL